MIKIGLVVFFAIVLGGFLGYFSYKFEKLAFIIAGVLFGLIVGIIAYVLSQAYKINLDGNLFMYMMMSIVAILFGIFAYFLNW